jgi:serine/threonine-protein kinase
MRSLAIPLLSRHVPAHSPAGENEQFVISKENEVAGYPRQLAPHLELRRVLGEGGSSIVFEAFHTRLKVPVAVKLLSVRGSIAEQAKIRLLREAELYALLDDPRIPRVYDVDELPNGTPFVVMEFVPGRSLEALLGNGPLSPRRAVTIAQEVLAALAYVHTRGVLHRDVKPANVLLLETEDKCQVRLVDFGIAKVFADAPESGGPLTQQGTLVGTPHYMAPERLLGEESDEKSDVYSVGVMLYEMLSGSAPFSGPTLGEVIAAVLRDDARPLHQACPHVSVALSNIVACAMHRDPAARHASAEVMLRALGQIDSTLQGEISSPRIVPAMRPAPSLAAPSVRPAAPSAHLLSSLEIEEEDLYRRLSRRRGSLQLPLVLSAGIALMAWAAWPAALNEREELDTPYAASTGPEAAPTPLPAAPELAAGRAALEAEVVQGERTPALAPGLSEGLSAEGLEAEGDSEPLEPGLQEGASEIGIGAPGHKEMSAEAPRRSVAAPGRRKPSEGDESAASEPTYEPVQSVPLQPLLDNLDRMLKEELPPPTASVPSEAPVVQPPAATTPAPSAPMKLPPLPRRSSGTRAAAVPENPY